MIRGFHRRAEHAVNEYVFMIRLNEYVPIYSVSVFHPYARLFGKEISDTSGCLAPILPEIDSRNSRAVTRNPNARMNNVCERNE